MARPLTSHRRAPCWSPARSPSSPTGRGRRAGRRDGRDSVQRRRAARPAVGHQRLPARRRLLRARPGPSVPARHLDRRETRLHLPHLRSGHRAAADPVHRRPDPRARPGSGIPLRPERQRHGHPRPCRHRHRRRPAVLRLRRPAAPDPGMDAQDGRLLRKWPHRRQARRPRPVLEQLHLHRVGPARHRDPPRRIRRHHHLLPRPRPQPPADSHHHVDGARRLRQRRHPVHVRRHGQHRDPRSVGGLHHQAVPAVERGGPPQ